MQAAEPNQLPATVIQQAGYDIYLANCPRCGLEIALNDPGKIICKCGTLVELIPPVNKEV